MRRVPRTRPFPNAIPVEDAGMGIGSMIVLISIIMASALGAGLLLNTAYPPHS